MGSKGLISMKALTEQKGRTFRRILAFLLATSLVAGTTPAYAGGMTAGNSGLTEQGSKAAASGLTAKAKSVTSYSYSVKPLLAPFNGYLYVKTNNPDPKSFRLADKKSAYITSSSEEGAGIFEVATEKFIDVKYEKASTRRVKGGYIFHDSRWASDGGTLTLQKRSGSSYVDTKKTVKCAAMKNRTDYLIGAYAKKGASFWEKLDAVQGGLDGIAVYPDTVYDKSKRSKSYPYPLLAASPYPELTLNEHYHMFEASANGRLVESAYPFVLDSAGFPGTMSAVAKKLQPKCSVTDNSYAHWLVDVTYQGKTRSYGGDGAGGHDPVYSNRVRKTFFFNGSNSDFALKGSIAKYHDQLMAHKSFAIADAKPYHDQIAGTTFRKKVAKGTWIRIGYEGWFGIYQGHFAYYASDYDGSAYLVSDAWVDGRYIDDHETMVPGATFKEHPTAAIVKRNMKYTDESGNSHVNDVVFNYDSSTKTWRAESYYRNGYWSSGSTKLPSRFILTKKQVKAMNFGAKRYKPPVSGLIYDGLAKPGTPFTNTLVTGVSLPKSKTVEFNSTVKIRATVKPSKATYPRVRWWESSNEKVATVIEDESSHDLTTGLVTGIRAGKAKITACTEDGGYKATCTVTVKKKSVGKAKVTLSQKAYTYNGKKKKPSVTVTMGGTTLAKNTDYKVSYKNNVKPGTAIAIISGKGNYGGKKTISFRIKGKQNLSVRAPKTVLKRSKLARKSVKVTPIIVKKAKGKVTYELVSQPSGSWSSWSSDGAGNVYSRSYGGKLAYRFNAKTGTFKFVKDAAQDTYKFKVKVRAAGNKRYAPAAKTVKVKIVVK